VSAWYLLLLALVVLFYGWIKPRAAVLVWCRCGLSLRVLVYRVAVALVSSVVSVVGRCYLSALPLASTIDCIIQSFTLTLWQMLIALASSWLNPCSVRSCLSHLVKRGRRYRSCMLLAWRTDQSAVNFCRCLFAIFIIVWIVLVIVAVVIPVLILFIAASISV